MSGADPPRWRQNRSESQLPHIITTGLEHKHATPLLPSKDSKPKLFDKIRELISPKRQLESQIHEPVVPSVANLTENAQLAIPKGKIDKLPSIVVHPPQNETPLYVSNKETPAPLKLLHKAPDHATVHAARELESATGAISDMAIAVADQGVGHVVSRINNADNPITLTTVRVARELEAAGGAISEMAIAVADRGIGRVASDINNVDNPITLIDSQVSSLLKTMSKFIDVVGNIATIHPYAQAAWMILSFASKMVIDQTTRDNSVRSLLLKMNEVYTFLMKEELRDIESMKTVVERICYQTLECSYFVREYSQNKKFRTRLLKNLISETDARVRNYNNVFDELMQQFRNRATGDTLVVVHRIWESIKGLGTLVEDSDLNSMPYVGGAGMDTRKTCLEGTRNEILNEITAWINNTEDSTRVFWLHGNAGTGKSSIAHTIAYRFKKLGRLGSCYCFDRNEMAEQRDKNIFTTIARDLADRDKQIRRELVAAVHLDTSLKNTTDILQQWKELIMKPALTLSEAMVGPIVIVIDALDESGGADSRQHILRILAGKMDDESRISKLPPNFRILLTSRPLPDIYDALNGVIHVQRKPMDSIPSALTQYDILRYVSCELSGLKGIQSKEVSASLARASDGLFEWARLACAYIKGDDDAGITAMERFELVITHNKDDYVPLLDSMYKLTLETIFPPDQDMRRNRSIRLDRFRSVMAQILGTAEPLPLASLNAMRHQFVQVRKTDINTIIRPMGALLSGTTDPAATIRPLHASFPEFLMDKKRSGEFFIDVSHIHNDLAFASLGVMKDGLQFNICRLPTSYLPNSEIHDLAERVEKYISPELSYSCRFWTDHLRLTQFNLPLAEAVRGFFNDEWLLFWLEVLSLLKTVNTCASWLSNVLQWVVPHAGCKDISDDIADTQRFVRMFGGTISFSTPHIYLSALPFSPKYSHISQKFVDRFCYVPQIDWGHSMTWPVLQGVLRGHDNTVSSVMFSPDGKCIVSGSSDQTIGLWDAETGELLRPPLKGHEDAVLCVVFSPDGKQILSGSHDQTIRLWDAETGELLQPPLQGHEDGVLSVAFSPDGKCIVSGSDDKTICLWNSETGELLQPPLKGHEGWVSSVAFSPDGKFIVSGSQDKTIRLWDAKTGELLQPALEGHMGQVLSVAFSADGKHIVSGSHDQTIRLWDAKSGDLVQLLEGHEGHVLSVAFSPDGKCMVSGSNDKTIRLWDTGTGKLQQPPLEGHEGWVGCVAFSPDGKRIVSGSGDQTIRLWDAEIVPMEVQQPTPEGHEGQVLSIAISPDSKYIVSGSRDKTIRLWDAATGKLLQLPLKGHEGWVLSVAFSPDGKQIVSGSRDKTIRIWNAETGELLQPPLQGHEGLVRSVAFSPDGKCIVSGSDDTTVCLWDAETGELLQPPLKGHESRVLSVVFSPNSKHIVSGSHDQTIQLWDAESGEPLLVLGGHEGQVGSVAFSPDGKCIVSGSDDKTICLWDAQTGELLLLPLKGHEGSVWSVAFSPDGKLILSGSQDTTIRLWDARTGELLQLLEGHEGWVRSVAFSPDGRHIVSGSNDKTIRLWDPKTWQLSLKGPNLICFSSQPEHALVDADEVIALSDGLADLVEVTHQWVRIGPESKLLFCVPPTCHPQWYRPGMQVIMPVPVQLDLSRMAHGHSWDFCYHDSRQHDMFTCF